MDEWIINPLRLGTKRREDAVASGVEGMDRLPLARQLALYVTLVLGNVASSFLDAYQAGHTWRPSPLALLFGLVVGLVLLPGAIDTDKLNGEREELVQFATVFTYGMGWQALLGAAIRAVAGG